MKREIKFRGKTAHGCSEWMYGNLTGAPTHPYIQEVNEIGNDWYHLPRVEVSPDTIGQFTGLRDKNGKEIYEGDIVLWERKKVHIEGRPLQDFSDVCKIYYDDQRHAFRYWYKITCGSASGFLTFNDDRAESSSIEVIGNIYDNPELLKRDQQ